MWGGASEHPECQDPAKVLLRVLALWGKANIGFPERVISLTLSVPHSHLTLSTSFKHDASLQSLRSRWVKKWLYASRQQQVHVGSYMYKQAPKFITNREYIKRTSSLERC